MPNSNARITELAKLKRRAGLRLASFLALSVATSTVAVAQSAPASLPATPAGVASDPLFTQPFIDIDEWRDAPVRHRYVHGGFKGTDMRFSFYFPEKAKYVGHFFQYLTPVPDSENLAQNNLRDGGGDIGFSINHGAYYIETNGGGQSAQSGPAFKTDPSVGGYRANAAAAQFSRVVAQQMYGGKRPYGYIWGGSGGAYRTIGSMENTQGVWDGAVPFVMGSPMATPYNFTAPLYAMRVLKEKWAAVVDAADVGGSGDIYAGLNDEQKAALKEILLLGFPKASLRAQGQGALGAFPVLYPGLLAADPTYFQDFWTKPGYEGYAPPASLRDARLQQAVHVTRLIMADDASKMGLRLRPQMGAARGTAELAWQAMVGPDGTQLPVGLELDSPPQKDVGGAADLFVTSGAAKGQMLRIQRFEKNIVLLQAGNPAAVRAIRPGDELSIDNSNWLAAQTYHRHQVPTPDYYAWNQFRDKNGEPIYPQRPKLLGPQFSAGAAGAIPSGKVHGKIIVVENLSDNAAWPWHADWYRTKITEYLGAETNDNFRLWYTEHAAHGGGGGPELVTFTGVLQQALLDVSNWVEHGVPPAPTTNYRVVDTQVVVPATAAERRGIQPVVTLRANGGVRADVAAGQPVSFTAKIGVPPGAGKVVKGEWDFEGEGTFPSPADIVSAEDGSASAQATYSFAKPGTYFAVFRATAQRQGDGQSPYARVMNLGRVRVVVR